MISLSKASIAAIGKIATGDGGLSPYRKGYELVELFNIALARNESYGSGFPSRWFYAEEKIGEIQTIEQLNRLIKEILDPRLYANSQYSVDKAVSYLSETLIYENLKIFQSGRFFAVGMAGDDLVGVESNDLLSNHYLQAQIQKCRDKIEGEDFEGAITNARTLVESTFVTLESRLTTDFTPEYDGDLGKLFKRVQKLLNLDPAQEKLNNTLREILTGFVSIVKGLSTLRNKMSDAHPTVYTPSRHHAKLAVNAAKVLVEFVTESYHYQQNRETELPDWAK
jgi:hypothetical protein